MKRLRIDIFKSMKEKLLSRSKRKSWSSQPKKSFKK